MLNMTQNTVDIDEIADLSHTERDRLATILKSRGVSRQFSSESSNMDKTSRLSISRGRYLEDEVNSAYVIKNVPISSFDNDGGEALALPTPFATDGVIKHELPIPGTHRISKTIFPPGSKVARHKHTTNPDGVGGSLRIVVSGSILFEGRSYQAGDWFFIPSGYEYEFMTDPNTTTVVFYKYEFSSVDSKFSFSEW